MLHLPPHLGYHPALNANFENAEHDMTQENDSPARPPGWDAKEISRVANDQYGGMDKMFAAHKWPERGSRMMMSAERHVKQAYGSVENFAAKHSKRK
jgi:hypothetical protein